MALNIENPPPVRTPILDQPASESLLDMISRGDTPNLSPAWVRWALYLAEQIRDLYSLVGGGGGGGAPDVWQDVAGAPTITIDHSAATHFRVTLNQNVTMANPINLRSNYPLVLKLVQDATGGRTVTWGVNWPTEICEVITLENTYTSAIMSVRGSGVEHVISFSGIGV